MERVQVAPTGNRVTGWVGQTRGFLVAVREEMRKVTWPTRRETMITTTMVLIMVALSSIFFLLVDAVLHWSVERLLLVSF